MERGLETYRKVSTRQLAVTGVMIALNLVLNQFTISFGTLLEIGFAFLPIALLASMYGPMNAGIASVVADTFGFMLRPNGFFFPGFTLNALLLGIIYGLFLHRKNITLMRVALATLVVTIVLTLILTPIWLNIMFGTALVAIPRLLKALLLYPVEVALLYTLLKNMEKLGMRKSP